MRHVSGPHPWMEIEAVDRAQLIEEKWAFEEGEIGPLKKQMLIVIVIPNFSLVKALLHENISNGATHCNCLTFLFMAPTMPLHNILLYTNLSNSPLQWYNSEKFTKWVPLVTSHLYVHLFFSL